jgi:hypothetical protein
MTTKSTVNHPLNAVMPTDPERDESISTYQIYRDNTDPA